MPPPPEGTIPPPRWQIAYGHQTPREPTFAEILRRAINDVAEQGYQGEGQISDWLARLRYAAERELGGEAQIDDRVRQAMGAIYQRLVERGRIAEYVPGIGRYTIAKVEPNLRAELDRRIIAAADLIKLNRRKAIETTLSRFQGWSTSIPAGGEGVIDKREVREHVEKSVAQQRFEERRVSIDQGHKLVANISHVVAIGNGAIAAIWHSHWRQKNYNYRKDHKERDDRVYLVRGSWAEEDGFVKPGPAGYLDDITQPGQEPFCRCYAQYISTLGRVPDSMLTKKGQDALAAAAIRRAA